MTLRYTHALEEFDFTTIHHWLSHTYWSPGISRERVERGFRRSTVVVGCFSGERQIGVARCTSDTTRFAYIADVYVDEAFRGQGVARQMVRQLLSHPEIAEVDNTYLLTQDAQLVYRPLGFDRYPHPERFMVRRRS
ncbi:MAG TPA: GNAT family N-acetyltransferase [Opitutaceae bacterium]|jgi:ribosomal protein S18 acetylase RimI-like enzyme|nr:GNAT family N-acetyltransferase [Opitutaceae bacterium]HRE04357.1 GNAT family N-acetyltransferase [Opitutaceae bacterium]